MHGARATAATQAQALVLTLDPKELNEFVPLFCRSCRKLVRKDCNAEVDWPDAAADPLAVLLPVPEALPVVLEVLPPKSPISFSNAELRLDSTLDDRLEEEPVVLSTWLLLKS